MTDAELIERVAQILHERRRRFYVDALELEVALWRDLAAEQSVQGHVKRVRAAHQALA